MAATTPDPLAIIQSRGYIAALVIAAIIGVPIAAFAYFFLYLVSQIQSWVYVGLPSHFTSHTLQLWWPIIPLAIAGLIVGVIVAKLPGSGGELPIEGFKIGKRQLLPPVYLWGILLAAVASIGLGAVIGPEAPLIALGGGLAYVIVRIFRKNIPEETGSIVSASGSFAAVSTLLGSPVTGAFLIMEASGLGGLLMEVALLPGFLAAGIGYLIFVGLDSLTGLGTFSLTVPNLPYFGNPTLVEFIWAIGIGLAAPFITHGIRRLGLALLNVLHQNIILYTTLAGISVALLAVIFVAATGRSNAYILFSGQNQLPVLLANSATLPVEALLLILLLKAIAYSYSLAAFRGGPTFPAIFLGATLGLLLANIPGLALVAGVGISISAMTVAMLKLPLTTILLTTILMGANGLRIIPLTIVAAVVSYVVTTRLGANSRTSARMSASNADS